MTVISDADKRSSGKAKTPKYFFYRRKQPVSTASRSIEAARAAASVQHYQQITARYKEIKPHLPFSHPGPSNATI